ncbi:MAG: DNA gyrase subunit A, partial [Caldilineales bacterium]|nr:DNA gyrase subunit A [Caldilineales bacterium]
MPILDPFGKVQTIDLDHEMRGAYLDYAMSVIVARALPDVRDGLKPVHRRILYAMHDMGLRHDRPYKKSARIVGEVLGKYHPHGDVAVYDAMVRLAQDFSMRYPLIDGQGNFGSVDGDNAAAMRYTEARLSEIAGEMLADIDKDTVDFGPNFDDTLKEPLVVPSALPNLLLNGASGIAVGMATNLPSHNLGEVVDALAFMLDHYHAVDEITLEHLLFYIKGPDFPTGGIVFRYQDGKEGREDTIAKAYASGRGRLTVQAKVHVEAMSRSRTRLVVTELPYQTTNGRVVERIAELVREGRLEGIADLRDESDRQGMRIVVELTRNVEAKDLLEQLYKLTPLRQTFGVSALALVNGEPHLLSLKRMLQLFIEHRREIVRRRSQYDLARAKERSHILEGLLIALANLDEVIATIRRSSDTDTARARLMERFKLTEIQAQAILDMPLKRLSQLERQKLEAEYKELKERIRYLEDLLAHPQKMLGVIKDELLALKAKYGDARRTQIVDVQGPALIASDFLSEEEVLVLLTKSGQLFRQSLAGRRRGSLPRRTADAPIALAAAPARDSLFLFTAAGQAVAKNIHQLPEDEGPHFTEQVDLRPDDDIVTMLPLSAPDENGDAGPSLFLYTREGRCKRIAVSELLGAAHTSPLVMNVPAGDALAGVVLCEGADDLLLATRLGQAIRFSQDDVRVMGLAAAGVLAMKLEPGDQIAGAGLCKPGRQVVLLTTKGVGLRTDVSQYPVQKRYGSGVAAMKLVANQGAIEAVAVVDAEPEMFPILSKGPMRVLRLE